MRAYGVHAALFAVATALTALLSDSWVTGDTIAALDWGRQLAGGDLTTFAAGPTPHPLPIALGALLSPLGADGAYVCIAFLFGPIAYAALITAVFDVGARLDSRAAGAFAVVLLVLAAPIRGYVSASHLDPAFAALALSALTVELRRPRRGTATLGLLAVAGLLRPEAWVLAGIYTLDLVRTGGLRRHVRHVLLAVAAPAVWMAMDLAVTGDALYSLHATDAASDVFYRQFTVEENLREAVAQMGRYVGTVGAFAGAAGLVLVARRRSHLALVVGGVLAITLGCYLALLVTGMSSNARYLMVPAALITALAGVAAAHLRPPRAIGQRRLRIITAGFGVLLVLQISTQPATSSRGAPPTPGAATVIDDAAELAEMPDARRLLTECPRVGAPAMSVMRYFGWFSGRRMAEWTIDDGGTSRPDLFVVPANAGVQRLFLSRGRIDTDASFSLPPGLRPGPGNRSWRLYVRPGRC